MRQFLGILIVSYCIVFGYVKYRNISVDTDRVVTIDKVVPVPGEGKHFLVVTGGNQNLSNSQLSELMSVDFRRSVKSDGFDFRLWTGQETVDSTEKDWFRLASNVKTESVPWIIISNGRSGFSGPLPSGGEIKKKVEEYK